MGDVAKLKYSVDTGDLVRAREELTKVKAAAETATEKLAGVGGKRATDAFTGVTRGATGSSMALGNLSRAANDTNYQKLTSSTGAAAKSLSAIETNAGKARNSLGGFTKDAGAASAQVDKAANANGRMAVGFGAIRTAIATLGLTAFIKNALSLSTSFEASMNDVQEKLGISIDGMGRMRDAAQELGITTAFSASQAADAMGNLAQAGLDSDEVLTTLPNTLNLAAAAGLELSRASVITTDTMNAFRLSVDDTGRIVDVLAAAGDAASTDVNQMAEALSKAGPTAAAFGISLEETTATLGVLANNGIKGSLAGTALSAALTRLVNPLGEGEKALAALNLSAEDFIRIGDDGQQQFIGYAESIDKLTAAGATNTEIMRVFGQEHGPKLQALFGAGSAGIREMEAAITSNGQAAAQAETKMQGLPGAVKSFQSAWEGASLAFSDSFLKDAAIASLDALTAALRFLATDGLNYVTGFVDSATTAWSNFSENLTSSDDLPYVALRNLGDAIKKIADFIKPVMPYMGELATVLVTVGASAAALSLTSSAIVGIGVAIKGVGLALTANPIGLAIAGIATAAYLIYDNWDGIVEWWSGIWDDIRARFDKFLDYFEGTKIEAIIPELDFSSFSDSVQSIGSVISSIIPTVVQLAGDVVSGFAQGIRQKAQSAVQGAVDYMTGLVPEWIRKRMEIRSPSRVTMALGGWTAEGFATGMTNKSGVVRAAALDLAQSAADAIERGVGQLRGGIADALINADSFKDAGRNVEGFLKGWLDDQIRHFAKNKIMAFLGADSSQVSMIGGLLDKLGNLSGSGIIGGIKNLLGGGTSGITGLLGSLKGAFSSGGVISTGLSSIGSSIASIGPALVPLLGIGTTLAAIKSAFGTSWKSVATGIEVGYSDGAVEGQNFDLQSKKKSFWRGREYATIYSELDAAVGKQLNDFFASMKTTITEQAGALGVAGADSILDQFSVAVEKFSGENAEAELQAWLSESTRSAYQMAFEQLGPEVQAIIGGQVDMLTAEVETISVVFDAIATTFDEIGPKLESVGLDFKGAIDEQIAGTYRFVEALGGVDVATERLQLYAREFVPASEQVNVSLVKNTEGLRQWNESLGAPAKSFIDTREELKKYLDAIANQRESYRESGLLTEELSEHFNKLTVAGLDQMEAVVMLEDAMIKQREIFATVTDAATMLNLRFDEYHPNAQGMAESLVEIMGGMDAFTSSINSYYSEYFSAEEQKQIALAASASEVLAFNEQLGMMGIGAINTKDQLRQFVESLDLSTAAGQRAFAASMEVSAAMAAVADSGQTANDIIANTPAGLSGAADAIKAQSEQIAGDFDAAGQQLGATMAQVENAGQAANDVISQTPVQLSAAADAVRTETQGMAASFDAASNTLSATLGKVETSGHAANQAIGLTPERLARVADAMTVQTNVMVDRVFIAGQSMGRAMLLASNDAQRYSGQVSAYYANAGSSVSGSASSASVAIRSLSGSIHDLGNSARNAASVASQAAASTAAAAKRAATAAKNVTYIDGSHMTGLDYVPHDGYIAELHKGEMVLPASVSDQIRALGPANSGISTPVAPQGGQGNTDALQNELRAMREELAGLRREQGESLGDIARTNSAIAGGTSDQNRTLDDIKRENERQNRRAAA